MSRTHKKAGSEKKMTQDNFGGCHMALTRAEAAMGL